METEVRLTAKNNSFFVTFFRNEKPVHGAVTQKIENAIKIFNNYRKKIHTWQS